eukprot:scaffold132300_cov60-Phaeocystis_antarctica.AAC.1
MKTIATTGAIVLTYVQDKLAQPSAKPRPSLRPSLRPAGPPEASFSAISCLRLPQASASLGQSAAWAALAGYIGRGLRHPNPNPNPNPNPGAHDGAQRSLPG